MDAPCSSAQAHPALAAPPQGLVVVDQPTAGTPGTEGVQSIWSRADAIVMSMGAQDMAFAPCGP
jgi:hypothetical protein